MDKKIITHYIFLIIGLILGLMFNFQGFNTDLEEQLNIEKISNLNLRNMGHQEFNEGYNNAIEDIGRLLWCEKQSSPPLMECIGVYLKKEHGKLKTKE